MAKNDYEVGYGKPPKETQYKLGESGNPHGRPKGVRNLATDLKEELEEKITVTEDGKLREMSKQRAMVKTMTAKALKGDMKAVGLLISLKLTVDQPEIDAPEEESLSEDEKAVMEGYEARLLGRNEGKGGKK